MRRLVASAESASIGYGGVSLVARATGVSRRAITEGMKELSQQKVSGEPVLSQSRIRRKGAGRKRTVDKDPGLRADLDRLVDPATRGDPESPLRWTCKSVRVLAEELRREGHAVSHQTVAPRGTPEKRPMRDTSKPANGSRQDKVVITQGYTSRQRKSSQGSAMIGYSDSTWAEDMAPQGCDQSADPAAGNAWAARAAFAAFLAGKR